MEEKNKIDCPLECGARIIYFTKHLKKCRNKNKLGTEFKICPYNSSHIIKANIYQIHIINCKDKPNNESEDDSLDNELDNKCDDSIDDDLDNKCNDSFNDDLTEKCNDNDNNENKENINNNNIPNQENNNFSFNIKSNNKTKKIKKYKNYLYEKEEDIDSDTSSFFNQVYTNIDLSILKKYIEINNN